jgi:hypothetical protein
MKNVQDDITIKESVRKLYDAQASKKQAEEYLNSVKKKESLIISNYIFSNLKKGENSFTIKLDEGSKYYSNPVSLRVTRVRTKKIIWDTKKLKKKLGIANYKKVVNKTYTVNDMDGLIEYLKTCNVNPKKFKKFITVEEKIDDTKVDTLYDSGEISEKNIEGCYELEIGEPYIRLTELK